MSAALIALGVLALLAGVALLVVDTRRRSARARVRRAWATHQDARYVAEDPVLTAQWHYGVFSRGGAGRALDLVNGDSEGNPWYLFDLKQANVVVCTVLALRRPTLADTVLELRRGSSTAATGSEATQKVEAGPVSEAGMDLLGHVGRCYAFTNDLESARRAVDERLVVLADAAQDDISVLWAEGAWALAAVHATSGTQRWDEVLALLARFADLVRLLPPGPARLGP